MSTQLTQIQPLSQPVEIGDEGDPADVGVAVLLREAEPLGEVLAHDVAVEDLESLTALAQRNNLPPKFLEQIMATLKRGGIVRTSPIASTISTPRTRASCGSALA